jgi:hypothetical protein
MSRGPQKFRQADLTKAIKGIRRAGIEVGRVEIDKTGTIKVFAAAESSSQASFAAAPVSSAVAESSRQGDSGWDDLL